MPSKRAVPPDHDRCEYTTRDGKRCQRLKDPLHRPMCDHHHRSIMRKFEESRVESQAMIAGESFLPSDQPLDSAQAINAVLTRIFRAVAENRYPPRQAAALGYLGQLIISTLPGLAREAAVQEKNPVGDRAATIFAELTSALRRGLPPETEHSPDNRDAESSTSGADSSGGSIAQLARATASFQQLPSAHPTSEALRSSESGGLHRSPETGPNPGVESCGHHAPARPRTRGPSS